jgi:ElaA protein
MISGELVLHEASFAELDAATLYGLLRLRGDVFVVEQACPYPDLDGRDTEPGTRHLWFAPPADPAAPCAYLRVLIDPDGAHRIGRVCTAPAARRAGLSGRLVGAALTDAALTDGADFVLGAQSQLTGFYARFGFEINGPEYIEDGIPHTPMRRATPNNRAVPK